MMRFQLVFLGLILLIASSARALNCNYCISFSLAFDLHLEYGLDLPYNNLPLMECKLCNHFLLVQDDSENGKKCSAGYSESRTCSSQQSMWVA